MKIAKRFEQAIEELNESGLSEIKVSNYNDISDLADDFMYAIDEVKDNPLTHETEVISMANAGPNTNGSQFFITHSPQPHLNGMHTVFGKATSGQDVVNSIKQGDKITKVTIHEK